MRCAARRRIQSPTVRARGWGSYVGEHVPVDLALLQQAGGDGLHGPQRLRAGGADQGLGQQEAVVARVPQLEGEGVLDSDPVRPVHGAARAHILEEQKEKKKKDRTGKTGLKRHMKVGCELNRCYCWLKEMTIFGCLHRVVEAGPYLYRTP